MAKLDFSIENKTANDRYIHLDGCQELIVRNEGDATLVIDGALQLTKKEAFEFTNNTGYPLQGQKEVNFKNDGTTKSFTVVKSFVV